MSWYQLPFGIRYKIYNAVSASTSGPFHYPLSRCAAVCKEWQCAFETKTYQRLTLTQSCLTEFENILASTPRRRAYIQHIHIRVELERYGCLDCVGSVNRSRSDLNEEIFKTEMIRLFVFLSTWEESSCSSGILLEISAVSPSDHEHYLQADVYLDANGLSLDTGNRRNPRGQGLPEPHDPGHGWDHGRQTRTPRSDDLNAVFGIYAGFFPRFRSRDLPAVPVITKFLLRRQTRRYMRADTLRVILLSLPRLEMFIHEPWRPVSRVTTRGYSLDTEYCSMIPPGLPSTLKHIIIMEDFNEYFNRVYRYDSIIPDWKFRPELVRTPSPSVAHALLPVSMNLTTLSISFLVEARDFFLPIACGTTTGTWDRLESLALTSLALRGEKPIQEVASLLSLAGKAALFMPRLHTMELWYGARRIASLFRYRVEPATATATITCRGTWMFEIQKWPEIEETWQRVSRFHTQRDLTGIILDKALNRECITSHAEAIVRLGICSTVIHPASLEEIRREADRYTSPIPPPSSLRGILTKWMTKPETGLKRAI